MTADRSRPAVERPGSFQDDLLADLRQAAPMPADRPVAPRPVIARTLPLSSPPLPDTLPVLVREVRVTPPTIELRLSSQPWSMPALRRRQGPPGLELSAGPIRLALAYLGG
ncbi:MAG TPA: hypothetical protein VK402_22115 [Blastococcus sp.]|nr:hypothetical protein [Blastococcus sp.]